MDKHKLKKKIITSATAASMIFGGTFAPPPDESEIVQFDNGSPSAYEIVLPDIVDDNDDDLFVMPGEEKRKKSKLAKRATIAAPIVIISWAAGIGLCIFMSTILNSVMSVVFSWFITILLGIITYCAVTKVMFPDLKLKQILRWKPVIIILAASTLISIIIKFILY